MRTKTTLGILAVIFLGLLWGVSQAFPPKALPPEEAGGADAGYPPCPKGKCCLYRIRKTGRGEIGVNYGESYACGDTKTSHGTINVKLTFHKGTGCDDAVALLGGGDFLLEVKAGNLLRRTEFDGKKSFAHLCGVFTLKTGDGKTLLFEGPLEALFNIGTHTADAGLAVKENCDVQGQMEGWLAGRGLGKMAGNSLRAFVAAGVSLPATSPKTITVQTIVLNGTVVHCP
jgi:hypothetical protein